MPFQRSHAAIFCLLTLLTCGFVSAESQWPRSLWIPEDIQARDLVPGESVSPADIKADIDALITTFQTAYGGWRHNGRLLETDVFPSLRKIQSLARAPEDVCRLIGKELDKIPDGHLFVSDLAGKFACQNHSQRPNVGNNEVSIKEVWKFEPHPKGTDIPLIAISTMAQRMDPIWKDDKPDGFLNTIQSLAKDAKALIIDLRGNGGGDKAKPEAMARILFGIKNVPGKPSTECKSYGIDSANVDMSPPSTQVRIQTPEASAVAGNYFLLMALPAYLLGQPLKPVQPFYRCYQEQFESSRHTGFIPQPPVVIAKPFTFDPAKIFKGPIRLLVDGNCASSCEWTLTYFENHPFAKSVGTNTAGAINFDNVGVTWLRHANLFVFMPTAYVEFKDHRFVEKVGFKPDIIVPDREDALDYALKDIKQELGN